jgi:hypothetical protein
MRITKDLVIAGLPALTAREWMRTLSRNNTEPAVTLDDLTDEGRVIAEWFAEEGFLEETGRPGHYHVTIKGASLAMASAAPPVKRATAQRALDELLARAVEINGNPELLMWVDRIGIFGSFLDPDRDELGDLDCVVWFSRRDSDGDAYIAKSVARAEASGRSLSFIEQLAYGELEVQRYLKGRSRTISLHDGNSDRIVHVADVRIVYERPADLGA